MKISNAWLASVMVIAFAIPTYAQSTLPTQIQNSSSQKMHKLDSTSSGLSVHASKLIGMKIENSRKENVGQVSDIVFDAASTRVQYVAVTYGGFLGLGSKLFAVPMQAIKVQQDPNYQDRVILVLDVTKEQLDGSQGFDESNWPSFSDTAFVNELHRRYKITDGWDHGSSNRSGQVDVNIGRGGVDVNVDEVRK
jgi:sporulation protein YlmC with PRC-barrel domain